MAEYVDPTAAFRKQESPAEPTETELALRAKLEALTALPVVQEIVESDEVPADAVAGQPAAPSQLPAFRPAAERPKPENQLTDEERRVRILEDQVARAAARVLDSDTALAYDPPATGEIIEFWIVKDGWGMWGNTWYRGQEIALEVGSQAYLETFDRNGQTWLGLLDDEFAQQVHWGDIYIRKGRWPGSGYDDPRAAAKEAQRARRVPVLRV